MLAYNNVQWRQHLATIGGGGGGGEGIWTHDLPRSPHPN